MIIRLSWREYELGIDCEINRAEPECGWDEQIVFDIFEVNGELDTEFEKGLSRNDICSIRDSIKEYRDTLKNNHQIDYSYCIQ